jgi:hypothetical protein
MTDNANRTGELEEATQTSPWATINQSKMANRTTTFEFRST